VNPRAVALALLLKWSRGRMFAEQLLDRCAGFAALSGPDRALAMELFYGCLRNRLALQQLAGWFVPKRPRAVVARILELGLFQLFYLEKIPAHAAVNETVALAKRRLSTAETGFVNAVLRQAARDRAGAIAKLEQLRETEPWVFHSHPQWLFERWASRFGRPDAVGLCAWNNLPPDIYIRVNTLKRPDADVPPAGAPLEPSGFHPLCWRVTDPSGLFESPAWTAGEIYAQDPSTLAAVDLLDPQPGETVLDMCAAPGGKTTYIAQKMRNTGRIIAADSNASRLAMVGENCRRLGVSIVATLACEGGRLGGCLRGASFERVLVDAPCSNTGVLRRRVDLRWRLRPAEIARLAALQGKLLAQAARLTGPGGVLVYSTCSLEAEENERVVERFIEDHPRFLLNTTRSTFPPRDAVDGVFVARFEKQ
jgi:16S rRNA (cytosine967-C5)-methyltransferase